MRIYRVGLGGVRPAEAIHATGPRGPYWMVYAGEEGRGRVPVRIPLAVRDFGTPPAPDATLELEGLDLRLVALGGCDEHANPRLGLTRGEPSDLVLVIVETDPGYRGSSAYRVEGPAIVVAEGRVAQGMAGRAGGGPIPVVLMGPGASVHWVRTGRRYGTPAEGVCRWDGAHLSAAPVDTAAESDAAYEL